MNNYDGPRFEHSHYDYRVALGKVMDHAAISWCYRFNCSTWDEVNALVDMWEQTRDYPAVEVNVKYNE